MKLTKLQNRELRVWEYFIPKGNWQSKTDDEIKNFFEWSERGYHKDHQSDNSYFEALKQGKRWAGIHTHEIYPQGILDGSMPYFTILGGEDEDKIMPREVTDFIKKDIFKGIDAKLIENCYQSIIFAKYS